MSPVNAQDDYVLEAPSPQNALDIFKNEWAFCLPANTRSFRAGKVPGFDDPRVKWFLTKYDVRGRRVLELGPLEAGHSYMLEQAGAERITAIEANRRAFLKCLIIKEIFNLQHCRFLLGDFMKYLENCSETFDLCFASGVLYHMTNPVEAIARIANVANSVFIWTHYYDEKLIGQNPEIAKTFSGGIHSNCRGFAHMLYKHVYGKAVYFSGFCGGGGDYSMWMTRDDLLRALRHFGFDQICMGLEQLNHPGGPALCVFGKKGSE